MWYRAAKSQTTSEIDFDEKIIRSSAERSVRRHLFLKGAYNPTVTEVEALVDQAMLKIHEKYGSFHRVRRTSQSDNITPAVDDVVGQLIK